MELLKNPENFDLESYVNSFRMTAPTAMLTEHHRNSIPTEDLKFLCYDKFFSKAGRAILSGEGKRLHIGNAVFEYSISKDVFEGFKTMGVLPIVLSDERFNVYVE